MTLPHGTEQYKTSSAWGIKPDRMAKESRCAFGHIYYGQDGANSEPGDGIDVARLYESGDFYVRSMESMFEDFKEVYKTEKRDSVVSILEVDEEKLEDAGKVLELEEAKSCTDDTKDVADWPSTHVDEACKDGVCPAVHKPTTQNNEYSSSTTDIPRSAIRERSTRDKLALPGPSDTSSAGSMTNSSHSNTSSKGSETIFNPSNASSEGSVKISSHSNTSSQGSLSTSSDAYSFSDTSMPSSSKTKTNLTGLKRDLPPSYKHTASELSLLQIMEQIRSRILSNDVEGAGDCAESLTDKSMAKTLRQSVTNILNIPVESVTQTIWTRLMRLFEYQTDPQGKPLRNFQLFQDYPDNSEEDNIEDETSEKIAETNFSDCGHSVKVQTVTCLESSGIDESFESIDFSSTEKSLVTERLGKKDIGTAQLFEYNELNNSDAHSGTSVDSDASGLTIKKTSRRRNVTNSRILRVCAATTMLYVAYLFHVHIILAFLMEVFLSEDQMAVFGALFPIIAVAVFVYFTCFYDLQ